MAFLFSKKHKNNDLASKTLPNSDNVLTDSGLPAPPSEETLIAVKHYIGDVTHSLRMPLAVISGYADILVSGMVPDDETKNVYLKKILEHAKYADERLSNLLQTAEIEFSGTLRKHPTNLVALVSKVVTDLSPLFTASNIRIQDITAENSIVCDIDELLFLKVIHNLLDNSRKHMGRPGTITITVSRGNGDVLLIIRDDGFGIDEDGLNAILTTDEAFAKSGNGFGLYHAMNVTTAHGGKLEIKTRSGDGFGVYITLPAYPGNAGTC
jgi:two-component system OmpR family sensor kinase